MDVLLYALKCYGLTIIISLLVIVVILGVNKAMNKLDGQNGNS